LLSFTLTAQDRPHLEEVDAITSAPSKIERHRPTALGGKTGHAYAEPHHAAEEEHRRFAKKLTLWIDKQIDRRGIKHLTVFADPQTVGLIRKQQANAHRHEAIELLEDNLIQLTDEALCRHPAILGVIQHV